MSWVPADALRHTQGATSEGLCRLWADVANAVLAETGNEIYALRAAHAAVRHALESEPSPGDEDRMGD